MLIICVTLINGVRYDCRKVESLNDLIVLYTTEFRVKTFNVMEIATIIPMQV